MKTLTARLVTMVDEELAQRVADLARRDQRSESAVVRRALQAFFGMGEPGCEIGEDCYGEIVGHHDDYAYPFRVRHLCRRHHFAWHHEHGPGLNPELAEKSRNMRSNRSGWVGDPDFSLIEQCEKQETA
jgi:hypothetical protein